MAVGADTTTDYLGEQHISVCQLEIRQNTYEYCETPRLEVGGMPLIDDGFMVQTPAPHCCITRESSLSATGVQTTEAI
jgi:hypothetical protein